MNDTTHNFAIAIHGGAGTILKSFMTPEKEQGYRDGLTESLRAGYEVLKTGGAALDAVQSAVEAMENNPLFNAGKGAVFTHEGEHEQDACMVDGVNRNAGSIAGVKRIANPITLARLVLDKSVHVLLCGEGAEKFAQAHGMELVEDKNYFHTEHRWEQLQRALAREAKDASAGTQLDHSDDNDKTGTVGAVACDIHGNLAAATSSGGMTNKRDGRIGDSAIVGAGTYADNNTCAVSTTGVGEYFMRCVTAFDVSALMDYRALSLTEAADGAMRKLGELGGYGGLIAIDRECNIVMPFNSKGMYRGFMRADGTLTTAIWPE